MVDSYAWFKGIVQDRRKLEGEALDRVADGRVFTGRQAIELKLADEIGREQEAIDWLVKSSKTNSRCKESSANSPPCIDPKTPVRDWRLHPRFSELSFLHLGVAKMLDIVGLESLARDLETSGAFQAAEKLNLDGLLALWHPSVGN